MLALCSVGSVWSGHWSQVWELCCFYCPNESNSFKRRGSDTVHWFIIQYLLQCSFFMLSAERVDLASIKTRDKTVWSAMTLRETTQSYELYRYANWLCGFIFWFWQTLVFLLLNRRSSKCAESSTFRLVFYVLWCSRIRGLRLRAAHAESEDWLEVSSHHIQEGNATVCSVFGRKRRLYWCCTSNHLAEVDKVLFHGCFHFHFTRKSFNWDVDFWMSVGNRTSGGSNIVITFNTLELKTL